MPGYSVTFSVVDQATKQIDAITKRIQAMRAPIERQARATQRFLDASGLRAMAGGLDQIARSAAGAFESMSRMVPLVGSLTGAATIAGMVRLVNAWADFGRTLQHDADYIGTTSAELEQLQNAMTLAGGSAASMTEALKNVAKTSYDAFLGQAPVAAQRLRQLGIALTDNNGKLRSAADLEAEEIDKISKITDARDRERVATELGGRALFDTIEDFRRSGKTREEWLRQARQIAGTTEEQQEQLRRYRQAIGELSIQVNSIGRDIAINLATVFTPVLKDLADWIRTHPKEIQAAIQGMGDALKYLADHLTEVKEVAEAIAIAFAVKWAIGAVAAIVKVTAAVRTLSLALGLSGGGLLRVLAAIAPWALPAAAAAAVMAPTEANKGEDEAVKRFKGMSREEQWRAMGGKPEDMPPPGAAAGPNAIATPPSSPAINPAATPPSSPAINPAATPRGLPSPANDTGGLTAPALGKGSARNQAIDYFVSRGWSREQAAGIAASLETESSWRTSARGDSGQAFGLGQWHPDRQRNFAALFGHDIRQSTMGEQLAFVDWELRNTERRAGTRLRSATTAREAGGVVSQFYERPADVAGNVRLRGGLAERILQGYQPTAPAAAAPTAAGPPATLQPGAPGATGNVNVTVTHRNPPPGTTIDAGSTGDVNLSGPRIEQQQLTAA